MSLSMPVSLINLRCTGIELNISERIIGKILNSKIKVGDIVELLPSNQRNRQLRSQEGKYYWRVLEIGTPQCFFGEEGFHIGCITEEHTRWVQPDDVQIKYYREQWELRL